MLVKWFFVASENLKRLSQIFLYLKDTSSLINITIALYSNERISVPSMFEPPSPS
jgi:hypothetical protein